jgi:hypothetical protein
VLLTAGLAVGSVSITADGNTQATVLMTLAKPSP